MLRYKTNKPFILETEPLLAALTSPPPHNSNAKAYIDPAKDGQGADNFLQSPPQQKRNQVIHET
ncbi:hypothetical protein AX660_07075 [Paraglaciecola hydrolytica]|uniref:Uncharacterized protein n=1 Tax=Paraglaciecola hydrolytica TaxID=1799789 RepID=A0A136A3I4_9ALTE|nr:hypothetical protein AX660_07075 [Paraglaciecola hydrolytica]